MWPWVDVFTEFGYSRLENSICFFLEKKVLYINVQEKMEEINFFIYPLILDAF